MSSEQPEDWRWPAAESEHYRGFDGVPWNEDDKRLAQERSASVDMIPDDLFNYVHEEGQSTPLWLECPAGHRVSRARLAGYYIYDINDPTVGDVPEVLVEFEEAVASAVPKPHRIDGPTYEDRIRITCPKKKCRYTATWTQAKLILLVADALLDDRQVVRLPS